MPATFEAYRAQVLDLTSHGVIGSESYLLALFNDGISVEQAALICDWDYEEEEYRNQEQTMWDEVTTHTDFMETVLLGGRS